MASQEELAEMERLSANFQPDTKAILPFSPRNISPTDTACSHCLFNRLLRVANLSDNTPQGPLIGERISSQSIVQEYAQADPTYVTKTEALQKTYPFYRTVQGDGNCGWRALPFGLFERLLATNSAERIVQETSRLEALNTQIEQSGVDKDVFGDFVDPTFELLRQLASLVEVGKGGEAEKLLLQKFNEAEVGNAVIMHFRLIASARLKIYADDYSPFLADAPDIPTYCAQHIDPFAAEIEQLGLQALSDAVFEPAGVAFEVLYLDRSEGGEVTRHEGGKGTEGTVRLLYRPGHYDLLYRAEDVGEGGGGETVGKGKGEKSLRDYRAEDVVRALAGSGGGSK